MLANPFWSAKMKEESRLRQMRPRELPPVPQDGSWDEAEVGVPIESGHEPPRRVEGGRVQHQGGKKPTKRSRSPPRARQEGVRETYRTPPSSWTEIREQPALGSQAGQAGSSELERELEKEMFEWIQEENLQLKEEIERLRQRESASSWSQVSEKTSPVPPPPRSEWESENRARFTPGGTQDKCPVHHHRGRCQPFHGGWGAVIKKDVLVLKLKSVEENGTVFEDGKRWRERMWR